MQDGVKLLKKWYIKDLNCVPASYILQPISSLLPNFFNSRQPKLQLADQEAWFDTLNALYKFILKGSEVLKHAEKISDAEFDQLRMSVIEREFVKGVVEAKDSKDDCFAFVRVIHNISYSDMDKVAHYVDTLKDGSVDKSATELAVKLRDEKLVKAIYKRNLKRFEIDWSGMEGISLESHQKYFTDFVTEFYKIMIRLIDRSSKKVARSELGVLKYELQSHLWIMKVACDWFVGREKEISNIKQYITGRQQSINLSTIYLFV